MGYFSGLHLELTLRGEFEDPNSPYYDYDPTEDEYPEEEDKPIIKKSTPKPEEDFNF